MLRPPIGSRCGEVCSDATSKLQNLSSAMIRRDPSIDTDPDSKNFFENEARR